MNPWLDSRIPGVVWQCSTVDEDGRPNSSPKIWVVPTSYDPPMVLMSLKPESDTAKNIEDTGLFMLQLPPASAAEKVLHTAKPLPRGENELEDVDLDWQWLKHEKLERPLPMVRDWPYFACWSIWFVETGDHTLFCGQVGLAGGFDVTGIDGGLKDIVLHRGRNRFMEVGPEFDVTPY